MDLIYYLLGYIKSMNILEFVESSLMKNPVGIICATHVNEKVSFVKNAMAKNSIG